MPKHAGCVAALALLLASPMAEAFDPLDPGNRYDYVIVAHDNFWFDAQRFGSLHPSLRSCMVKVSEIQAAFPNGTVEDRIRSFVLYAYQNWAIAPTYLLLVGDANMSQPAYNYVPTHYAVNPFFTLGEAYADDGYYVASPIAGQVKPIMHVGRIPARIGFDVVCPFEKEDKYQRQGYAYDPAWTERMLMLVGDAHINEFPGDPPNATYRTMNDELRATELSGWNPAKISTYYAATVLQAGQDPTAVTRAAWDAGRGFVNALGNTQSLDWLVFMAYFNLSGVGAGTGYPTFSHSLTVPYYTPVVFANCCQMNWFYGGIESCIGEDLLMNTCDRGAVAVVGPSHMVDMVETYALNRTFVHAMVADGVRNLAPLTIP